MLSWRAFLALEVVVLLDRGFISRLPLGPFASRPRLVTAILIGVVTAAALLVLPNALSPSTRTVVSWDLGCLWFIGSTVVMMARGTGRDIRLRAADQDEGRHFILALVLTAAVVSLGVIAVELSLAKAAHGMERTLRVASAFGTVAISWFVMQLVFALHYAHAYYASRPGSPGELTRGLAFPHDDGPDYWDFLHFALVIGVACQTADISFTEKVTRRIGSIHSVMAFTFNTVVLALTINLLAGLF